MIIHDKDYNEAADLWSIGCILSEVFQKTVRAKEDVNFLFQGDSCFPLSPFAANAA